MKKGGIRQKTIFSNFAFFDELNADLRHMSSRDDICTPMACVKMMLDYIPDGFWRKQRLRILDPCAGNGNFGLYCAQKTNEDNIWYNELNEIRFENCKKFLNPKHIQKCDFFEMGGEWLKKWDLIMANPPYSGGGNKNRSLSNQFIERSIDLLKDGGYLCFVTPNNWMTYNNNNTTLAKLLNKGSFLVIDNDVKKFFSGVGSSFTVFVWQKGVFDNKTFVKNNYLVRDEQKDVIISKDLPFIPLYISQPILNIIPKLIDAKKRNLFNYRCDLHNFTQKKFLSDICSEDFPYKTIHTVRKMRYASKKQDIFDDWVIIFPLSTYYVPYIAHNVNVTQSVGYMRFSTEKDAVQYLPKLTTPQNRVMIHLTRYGNFNNLMVLKHLIFDHAPELTPSEQDEIARLNELINY